MFKKLSLTVFIALISLFLFIPPAPAQKTIFTNTGKAKYIKTTVDTFSIPGVTGTVREGFITNQTASKQLTVYFSNESGVKDTSSRVIMDGGKTLHFKFKGTKIFRVQTSATAADSVYSQVIVGQVELNSNDRFENKPWVDYASLYISKQKYVYALFYNNKFLKPERLKVPSPDLVSRST